MPQALQGPPPPPNPDQQGVLSAGGSPQQPGAPGQPAAPPPPMPAPTHNQTVATLRHFAAIGKELETVVKDPDLGKADVKDKLIDAVTTLVADRIIPPGQAVAQLATFPDRPFEQKQWVMNHLQQIAQAKNAVLAHHAAAFAGQPPQPTPAADGHMQDVAGMVNSHYAKAA